MWIKTSQKMPKKNEYVLVHTPFCKYKCSVAFYNGVNWRSADNEDEIWNVNNWQKLPNVDSLI